MKLIEHFVGGKLFSGSSDRKGKVFNPATGEQESEVKLASKSDLDQAVEIAKKAFETWSLKPALQRARVMFKFKELIEKNSDELTKLIVSEHGKVFEDARGSLTRGLEVVEFACGIPHLLKGEFSENSPFNKCGIPQANSTTSSPLVKEPLASSKTLPCSETINFVNSSEFFSINSLNLNIILALCRAGFRDQVSNAFFATSTALSKSDLEASLTSDSCSPVAGLKTFPFLSEDPGIILPFTKCSIKFMNTVF